ncbi:MAG: hypothetical protein WD886_01250 [Burkholderiales bacterium]
MRALAFAVVFAVSFSCSAAPFAVRLGDERIVLDAPPGFADTLELASPRLQELAESLTPASNRILLFALTDADLRRFSSGDTPELLRYFLVATPRALERKGVGLSDFRAFAAETVRGLGEPMASADLRAYLDSRPIGQPSLVRELRRTPLFVSLLIATRLPPRTETEPQYLLHTTTLMLVRGKALSVSTYTRYRDASDADWLLDATLRWTGELQRLNGR